MAFFLTQITEDTEMLIETETTGAFNKSALEVRPDPKKAFLNTVRQNPIRSCHNLSLE